MKKKVEKIKKEKSQYEYDLKDRTVDFARDIITYISSKKSNWMMFHVYKQLFRSATSFGANYYEADCAESKKDFIHKMGISNKEVQETIYWLNILFSLVKGDEQLLETFIREAKEINLIFSSIISKCKKK